LVRLRENAESVALYRGEAMELDAFQERFRRVFENFWQIMKRQKRLTWFTSGYAQVALIFPVVAVAPRYFAKQIGLGGLMQAVNAFTSVQSSLSFIITSYTDIAAWQAVTERLIGFEERLSAIHHAAHKAGKFVIRYSEIGIAVDGVDLDLPDGTPLLRAVTFAVGAAKAVMISGPTGCRKEYIAAGDSRYLAVRSGRNQAAERANSFCTPTSLSADGHGRHGTALPWGT
jgi:putative ATP-binding cassette transporter